MVDYDTTFNTSGKFPTDAGFFKAYESDFVSKEGILDGFKTVLGEQVFRPLGEVRTPMYNRFAGRPLPLGSAWKERAIAKNTSRHLKPKATAEDDLGYADSEGIEATYPLDVKGWIKTSLPSDLQSIQMMLRDYNVGMLNDLLVENVLKTYQADMESAIGKKVVSNIKNDTDIDFTDGVAAFKTINKLAIQMMGEKVHYNDLTSAQNLKIRTASSKVLCFIDAQVYEDMISSFSALPSPEYINKYVEFIPMMDGCPTPITSAEFAAGTGEDAGGTSITWVGTPVAINEPQPVAMLMSADAVEYRPLIGSYRINMSKNGAGDFTNEHLLWEGSIKVSPFENMLRINQTEEDDGGDDSGDDAGNGGE